jgi:hypothetical protein
MLCSVFIFQNGINIIQCKTTFIAQLIETRKSYGTDVMIGNQVQNTTDYKIPEIRLFWF